MGTVTWTKVKLPAFIGKPLIKIPETIPQIGFLKIDFGEAFLEEYYRRVQADYGSASALNVLSYRDGVVIGSNTFAVVHANQILREEGLRTATQADLEKALRTNALELRGTFEDTGLVLRSEEDKYSKNTPIARDVARQITARGGMFSPENPVMIPLIGLELETADNHYGLTFRLREDAEVYEAPVLRKNGEFNSEDINEKTGLPRKTRSSGSRSLYTSDNGLSGLFLDDVLDLLSGKWDLGYSNDNGRVVVVREGTSPEKSLS